MENPSSEWRIDEKGWITDQNNSSKGIRFLFLKQNFGGMEMSKIQRGKGWRTQLAHRQVNMKQSWINQRQQRKWGCGANSHPDRLALAHRLNNNFLEGCGEKRKKKKKGGVEGKGKGEGKKNSHLLPHKKILVKIVWRREGTERSDCSGFPATLQGKRSCVYMVSSFSWKWQAMISRLFPLLLVTV